MVAREPIAAHHVISVFLEFVESTRRNHEPLVFHLLTHDESYDSITLHDITTLCHDVQVCTVPPVIVQPVNVPAVIVPNVPLAATRVPQNVASPVVPLIEKVVTFELFLPTIPFGLIRISPVTHAEYVPICKAHDVQKLNQSRICFVLVLKLLVIKFHTESMELATVAVLLHDIVPTKSRTPEDMVYFSLDASAAEPKYIPEDDRKYPACVLSENEVFQYEICPHVITIEDTTVFPNISTLNGAFANFFAQSHIHDGSIRKQESHIHAEKSAIFENDC